MNLWPIKIAINPGFTIYSISIGMTTTGINLVENEENAKLLPCITLYPFKAFRTKGFHYTSESYNQADITAFCFYLLLEF